MKYFIILLFLFFINSCFGQSKKVIKACRLPLSYDSVETMMLDLSEKGRYVKYKNGKECFDTTGIAENNRKKSIGDTEVLRSRTDTTMITLFTSVDGVKLKTIALKVIYTDIWYTYELYEDTLTKVHYTGDFGYGRPMSNNYLFPFKYLQIDKTIFPTEVKIYGEFN